MPNKASYNFSNKTPPPTKKENQMPYLRIRHRIYQIRHLISPNEASYLQTRRRILSNKAPSLANQVLYLQTEKVYYFLFTAGGAPYSEKCKTPYLA